MCLTKFFDKPSCKNGFSRFFKMREQFMDSTVTLDKTKGDFFKLYEDFINTVYSFHSANSLILNTVCITNRLSRQFIGNNKIYYKSDISNR